MTDRSGTAGPLWIIALAACVALLYFGRSIFIPLIISVLIAYTLAPIVGWLQARRIPRTLAAIVVMTAMAAGVGAGAMLVVGQADALIDDIPRAAQNLRKQIQTNRRRGGTIDKLEEATTAIERTTRDLSGAGPAAPAAPAAGAAAGGGTGFELGTLIWWGSMSLLALATHAVVVFFLVLFLLLSGDLFKRKIVKIAGAMFSTKKAALDLINEIDMEIKRYLLVRLLTTVIVGVATWAALAAIGLSHAPVWGLVAGVCNVIPYLGPAIVSGGLLLVGLLEFGSLSGALLPASIALAITGLEGWLIDPPLMGKVERMNTVAVLVGLVFWTGVWGAWGALLAVPMLAIAKSICTRVDVLKPIGELLSP